MVQERPRSRRYDDEDDDRPRGRRDDEADRGYDYDEDEEELRPGRRRPRRSARGDVRDWQKVRTGVTYALISVFAGITMVIVVFCAGFAFGVALFSSMGGSGGQPPGPGAMTTSAGALAAIVVLGMIGALAWRGLAIVGNIYCLAAPAKHAARVFSLICLGLMVGGTLFYVLSQVLQLAGGGFGRAAAAGPFGGGAASTAGGIVGLVGTILESAWFILFLLFLRAVCLAMREEGLARSVLFLLFVVLATVLSMGIILVAVVATAAGAAGGAFGPNSNAGAGLGILVLAGGCLFLVLFLASLIWYIVTLFQVRGAITNYLGGR